PLARADIPHPQPASLVDDEGCASDMRLVMCALEDRYPRRSSEWSVRASGGQSSEDRVWGSKRPLPSLIVDAFLAMQVDHSERMDAGIVEIPDTTKVMDGFSGIAADADRIACADIDKSPTAIVLIVERRDVDADDIRSAQLDRGKGGVFSCPWSVA